MKKVLLLIFASVLLMGCKKRQIREDLYGYWIFEGAGGIVGSKDSCERYNFSGLTVDGYYFKDKNVCRRITFGSSLVTNICNYYIDSRDEIIGEWKIKGGNIELDWGDSYIRSGDFTLDCDSIEFDVIFIDGVKFIKKDYVEVQS